MTSLDVCFLPAHKMLEMVSQGEISAVELLECHLEQIEKFNGKINAIVTLDEDRAKSTARLIDQRISKRDPLRILEALPIAHKDLTLTKGMKTTFGSPIFENFVPDQNALIVDRLQQSGAVTIGKTNTPEFGAGSQTFNNVFGATRNPYDLEKTCGGSSGGAAAALAAGLIPIADGSDLGGSLRNPASFCNVVGFRPSTGRVPVWPNPSAWFPLSVLGPMARTVTDVSLMLSAIAGPDRRCPLSIMENPSIFQERLARDFNGVRVAWSRTLGGLPVDDEVLKVIEGAVRGLEGLGCIVEEVDPDLKEADEVFHVLRAWHMESSLGDLLKKHPNQFKDTLVWNIEQGKALKGLDVARAERLRTALFDRLNRFMDTYEFIICPVTQVLPFDIDLPYVREINGNTLTNYLEWMKSCFRISVTGHPALSVPAGFSSSGLPVGLQIIGRFRDDFGVLQFGHAFEQLNEVWKTRPQF
ncbi:amidase [Burkholderiales bacterium]|nr:amidase [Burkholderiales bacterium]